jgi:hypothetical protein
MIRRCAAAAGIATKQLPGDRGLSNGGTLEKAAAMANHASTTPLYDRRRDEVSLDEVDRIAI